ncbi:MAG: PHP-associated domain-containing protein [Chloroflexota bacterium]
MQETPAEHAARDVDLHVHTLTSRCGYTSHRRLLELTRAAGRRVVAVTDHDSAAGGVELRELAARTGDDVLVLIGMELTTSDFGHVVLFGRGLERDWGWKTGQPFPRHIPDHWIAIQAHPYRGKVTVRDGRASAEDLPDPPARIDAVEVWNGGDILKKSPGLRGALDDLSRAYIEKHGKIAVASSDGHRPHWVHSFFTRFDRAIENIDDAIEQLRAGQVTPMASGTAYHAACTARWQRREIVEWHESGKDWRAMAAAAGYEPEDAEGRLALYQQVKGLAGRGATLAEVAGKTGLSIEDAMDYLGVVEEESEFAAQWRV